jgi:hypothetical protein
LLDREVTVKHLTEVAYETYARRQNISGAARVNAGPVAPGVVGTWPEAYGAYVSWRPLDLRGGRGMNKREEEISREMLDGLVADAVGRGLTEQDAREVLTSVLRDAAPGENPWRVMVAALDVRLREVGLSNDPYDPQQIDEAAAELVGAIKKASRVLYEVEKELSDRPLLRRVVYDVAFDLDNAQFANQLTELAGRQAVA